MSVSDAAMLRTPIYNRRHTSHTPSPTSNYLTLPTSSTATSPRSQDPQRVMLERWYRIAQDMTTRRLPRKSVVALNRSLDEAENILACDAPKRLTHNSTHKIGLGILDEPFVYQAVGSIPLTPPYSSRIGLPERKQDIGEQHMDPAFERITHIVKELQKRHEEFKYFHDIFIAKAEKGSERIVQLETQLEHLEDELMDDQSELTYLKLKLETLETQVVPHVPSKESNKLAQGLRRWKLDWADVENRFRLRRRKQKPEKDPANRADSSGAVSKDERVEISRD